MSDYVIVTDSTTDLPPEMITELGVRVLPFTYTVGGREYTDTPDHGGLSSHAFYDLERVGRTASTAAINLASLLDVFEDYLRAGTDVLYIAFSSALSSTCNGGLLAARELREKYPERKIFTVDSLCASMGEGLLVWHAVQRKRQGMGIEELAGWLQDNRLHLCHIFTVDDLNHLKRSGRLSATSALVGTVLGIKPILHVEDTGRLVPIDKVRGRRQSIVELVDRMEKTAIRPQEQTVFISHGDCEADARFLAEEVRRRMHVKDIVINFIGPVIGAHSGPGTLAVFFMGRKR